VNFLFDEIAHNYYLKAKGFDVLLENIKTRKTNIHP
jgi:hypothetical protein